MSSNPKVVPRSYTGEESFSEWRKHFEEIAASEKWTEEQKIFWLKFRLVGPAQRALQTLSSSVRESYAETMDQLERRF